MQATARIFIQKAPAKRTHEDLCPVKLAITFKRQRKYYSIREKIADHAWLYIAVNDIDSVMCKSPRGKFKDQRIEYDRIVKLAEDIIKSIQTFSFAQFEDSFFNRVTDWDNFFESAWNHAKELRNEGRFGYASSFECMIRAVKEFHEQKEFKFTRKQNVKTREDVYLKGKPLRFVDISPSWLKRLEKHMKDNGLGRSSQGIYIRNIRVLFNIAREKRPQIPYPFTEYKPKKAKGRKLALTAEQISSIANCQPADPVEEMYRDLFMFSFFANGMNISDILRLKRSNIISGELVFVRKKTENEEVEEVPIRMPVTSAMASIIDKHGSVSVGHDGYIFPFLRPEWNEEKCFLYGKSFIKKMNDNLKRIAKAAGIKEKISSYTARHSFATISKNSGASVEFISEALGHSNVNITKAYLKGFEDSARQQHANMIEKLIYSEKAG